LLYGKNSSTVIKPSSKTSEIPLLHSGRGQGHGETWPSSNELNPKEKKKESDLTREGKSNALASGSIIKTLRNFVF